MKKQSGFTLIELMVVMAIIAILATAGLSAYTGYIKKARDTTRIADISAINNIALGAMTVNGTPPTAQNLANAIKSANNNQMLEDPLKIAGACCTTSACTATTDTCAGSTGYYSYTLCDNDTGFAISTKFESSANAGKYATDIIPGNDFFDIGSCQNANTGTLTTTAIPVGS